MEVRPKHVPSSCLNENICIQKYFSSDAWSVLCNVVAILFGTVGGALSQCVMRENSIVCESCVMWQCPKLSCFAVTVTISHVLCHCADLEYRAVFLLLVIVFHSRQTMCNNVCNLHTLLHIKLLLQQRSVAHAPADTRTVYAEYTPLPRVRLPDQKVPSEK